MKKNFSRVASLFLAVMMLISLLPTGVLASETVTEQIVKGTISFPDDAYLEGGSLIVDVWATGDYTDEYKKIEFEIKNLDDADFEFSFPADETAVSIRVMLSNLSGAKTNLYTATSSNLDFTLTENGMVDTWNDHYFAIAELAEKEILMPCGKMISGEISGDNLQFVENACMTLSFGGNYWTRAFIDPETHEYSAVMPYGIPSGNYAPRLESSSENATSNVLNGTYYYQESESVTIDPTKDLTGLNFVVDTGYAVSGVVTIPNDAEIDNYDITSELSFGDNVYYVTGLTTKPGLSEDNRSVPYMFGVDKESSASGVLKLSTYGYMADDMLSSTSSSNVLVGSDYSSSVKYYYSETATTLDEAEATTVTVASDVENINFALQVGVVCTVEMTMPEGASDSLVPFDFYVLCGDETYETSGRYDVENEKTIVSLVVPQSFIGQSACYMYKIWEGWLSDSSTLYDGEVYLSQGGYAVTTLEEAVPITIMYDNAMTFEFLEKESSGTDIPAVPDVTEEYTVNFTIKDVDTNEEIPGATVVVTETAAATAAGATLTASDYGWATGTFAAGNYTVTVTADGYYPSSKPLEVVMNNQTVLVELQKKATTPVLTEAFFVVLDEDTGKAVPNALISVMRTDATTTAGALSLSTSETGYAEAELEAGTYTVTTVAGDYIKNVQDVKISGEAQEIPIFLKRPEISVESNTTFTVRDGDVENTPVIAGANLTLEDADGKKYTLKTDASGKASLDLEDGEYTVAAMADGYQARSFKIERSDTKNSFTVYLNKDEIIKVTSTVKEMTKEEIEAAGISVDENRHVYNCSAVLTFMPDVVINYIYSDDGKVLKGETVTQGNTAVTPVARDIFLIVKSSTAWLKEIFEVQLVCDNTSAVETIENLTANMTIPNGLSLAIMEESKQSNVVSLGDVAPKGNAAHKWYLCGDTEGEYKLSGALTGTRVGGGIEEDISINFSVDEPITVLAGTAMKLTIEAETHAVAGKPYRMRYTLENVSKKTLYDLSFTVFGGKFFEDYNVTAAEYAKEYGPDALTDENLDGEGFLFETEEFAPDEKISGVFTITFGEGLELGEGQGWHLTDAFTVTGAGSTTVIPTDIVWIDVLPVHNWNDGEVTTAPTCETDGVMTYTCQDTNCDLENKTYTEAIPATGHKMGDYVTTDPTCTADGSMVSKCQNTGCDHSVSLPIAALGHDWKAEKEEDKAPTCTEPGSKSTHCTRCAETKDAEEIPALDHDMSGWVTVTPAKCEEAGLERSDCSRCDHYTTNTIPATDHKWDNGTVTTPPTADAEGERTYTCENGCGKTKSETIPKLVPQDADFMVKEITITYGEKTTVYNETYYNESVENGKVTYTSSDESVATVDANGKVTIVGAGETTITATAAATEKYTETPASYELIVKKAPLTVKPKTVDIFYGEAAAFSEVEGEGFVLGEDVSVLTGDAVFNTAYKAFDKAGEYEVTVAGISANNYEITYAPGVLNVKKAEKYEIVLSMLSYRKGDEIKVKAEITPADASAEFKLEYNVNGEWSETAPTEIGTYKVRASLVKSDNIAVPETPEYTEAELEIKAGAMITVGGEEFGIGMETNPEKGTVEFTANDETVEQVIENVPSSGEVVIDATGATDGINTLVLPENIVKALDESDKVENFTVIADDAEITMDADVLSTAADKMDGSSSLSVKIDAVDKSALNEEQQKALDAISTEAHVIQLNLVVTNYDENGKPVSEDIHELRGKVDIKARYDLPDDMDGKRIVVCYVSDNGSVTYKRAEYKDGFVHFTTDHFSYYAIMATECPHDWDDGKVITPATTTFEGLIRYTCSLCDDTKDEAIPKKSVSTGNGGGLSAGGDKSNTGADKLGETESDNADASDKTDAPVVSAPQFADLGNHSWAADAINALADAGIIRGTSATTFSPASNITRADFAILLVRAFGLTSDNTENFADVNASDYFASELAIARNTGIVGGIGDNKYAPRNAITRQDMMVIAYRAIESSLPKGGGTVEDGGRIYPDYDTAADYAKEAVSALIGAGLVNGKNGRIAPNDYTTRAEVAVLLQRILEYVK